MQSDAVHSEPSPMNLVERGDIVHHGRDSVRLQAIWVRPVCAAEDSRFQDAMRAFHYLGALSKIGNTLWSVACVKEDWVALVRFSAAALKCAVRDEWVGWAFRPQFDRLNLVANNARFLILLQWHDPNVASRVQARCRQRIQQDWRERFGFPLLLVETFVDPTRYKGTIYQAANWRFLGFTQGSVRTRTGYSNTPHTLKKVFVLPLHRNTRTLLAHPLVHPHYQTGVPRMQ